MSKKHKTAKEKLGKEEKSDKAKKPKSAAASELQEAAAESSSKVEATSGELPSAAEDANDKDRTGKGSRELKTRQITLISKALADPTRMLVLRSIAKGGSTCGDLRECAGVSAATLSHHMKELEAAGLIETERKGRFVSATFQRKVWKRYLDELKSLSK